MIVCKKEEGDAKTCSDRVWRKKKKTERKKRKKTMGRQLVVIVF